MAYICDIYIYSLHLLYIYIYIYIYIYNIHLYQNFLRFKSYVTRDFNYMSDYLYQFTYTTSLLPKRKNDENLLLCRFALKLD